MNGDAFVARVPRDVVRVHGRDAVSFLQGQLSQDVAGLAVGASAWSFVLQPQGKVDAWLRVTRTAGDAVVLDVDGGWGDALVSRLQRFELRVELTIERLEWQCLAVRGVVPDANVLAATRAELVIPVLWAGSAGVDLLGPAVVAPVGVAVRGLDAYESWRVRVGMPAMGRELDERTIPAEAGVVDRSVSFTKGCYTGQELVARVDSRGGNTPRRLRAIGLAEPGAAAGDEVLVGGGVVGAVTSAAGVYALAYVRREVEPPADAVVQPAAGGHALGARVLPLPA